MGKRQRTKNKVSGQGQEERKKKCQKDPDPNSKYFIYDEVDQFHSNKDEIMLDLKEKSDDSDLENVEEEVFPLESDADDGDSSSVEGSKVNELTPCSDDDDGDDTSRNDRAWGRNKNAFYDADVQDDDVYTSDDEAEITAVEEEKEAIMLQKRLAKQLDNDDFYSFEEKVETISEKVPVDKDFTILSQKEKLEILAEDTPELLPLLDEFTEKFHDLRDKYHPLMLIARKGLICNQQGVKFIELKHQMLLNYLVNISFYLALKASKETVIGHPVVDVLVRNQQILSQMKSFDDELKPEIDRLLIRYNHHIKENFSLLKCKYIDKKETLTTTFNLNERKDKTGYENHDELNILGIDPLAYYNVIKRQNESVKTAKKVDQTVNKDQEIDVSNDDSKRMITYEMSKNKGLIRNRRKELKNPRIKHKVKFKNAVIKRKGQVREVRNEINRYGGETTGIK